MNRLSLLAKKVTDQLDKFNDRFTSYRLVLYVLIILAGWAFIVSFFNKVPYSWDEILMSTVILLATCWLTNMLVSKFLNVTANKESDLITALILVLILPPPSDSTGYAVVAAAGVAAIASKYIITYSRAHIFNPAAVGAYLSAQIFHQYPSWWVGTKWLTPVVAIGGLFILRKMKRFILVAAFLATFGLIVIYTSSNGSEIGDLMKLELLSTPVLFFAVIMLIEPLTTPSKLSRYLPYSIIVGILYTDHRFKMSPEEALLIGGLFTFIFARNRRYPVKFIRKLKEADGIYSYAFTMPRGFKFEPGQYLEWTLAQNKTDNRGNRRYLTIASSPTEPGLMFTIKHPNPASTFKSQLDKLKTGDVILASRLAGGFTMPKDTSKKIAWLAGGIGVTPFRSMAQFLVDAKQKRDVALLYSANKDDEISFKNVFAKAETSGLQSHYITKGRLDQLKIQNLLPDYRERRFYISGPYGFVNASQEALLKLGVKPTEIVTDYFPGYGS